MKKIILNIITGLILLLNIHIYAQEKVIKIWQDNNIPGAIYDSSYEVETIYTEGKIKLIGKVSIPNLHRFPDPDKKKDGTAVIICPGGGYKYLAIDYEGMEIADWLNSIGINAFVLEYRLPSEDIMQNKSIGPLQDIQEAVRIVRRNADEWNIDTDKIGVIGFSAGGHLASTISTHYNDIVYNADNSISARPDFSILMYPVISLDSSMTHSGSRENLIGKNPSQDLINEFSNELKVTKDTPPAFLVHAADDDVVPIKNSYIYLSSLKKYNIACELFIYEKGGHGFGLGEKLNAKSSWTESCKKWLTEMEFLK